VYFLYWIVTPPSGVFLWKIMIRERLHMVVNKDRLFTPTRGVVVEAHPDDVAMARVSAALTQNGVGLSIVTFTDGAGRNLVKYPPDELAKKRWEESRASAAILGAAEVYNAQLPDGQLRHNQADAVTFLSDVIVETLPDFIIAPHPGDAHEDHVAASLISRLVAGTEIPVYWMDTINGLDSDGQILDPTHRVVLSQKVARQEIRAYRANKSQTTHLPPAEMRDVYAVINMSQRRGREQNAKHAGVLFKDLSANQRDPIGVIFQRSNLRNS
jgi:LmbE family N-acetylglucosaminyl deacetylase